MKKAHPIRFSLLAVAMALPLSAAPPKAPPRIPTETLVETTAENVILPNGANGIVVYSECKGCPMRSSRTSVSSVYRFNEQALTLQELRSALVKYPKTNINVIVAAKTRDLLLLDATNEVVAAPAARPARSRTK